MIFDTAPPAGAVEGTRELAGLVGLRPGAEPIWVCGSTGPGEEALVTAAYRNLLPRFPALRLAIVPRHPERFDEAADLIARAGFQVVRRSASGAASSAPSSQHSALPPVVLGDTTGELTKFYSLADVVFVGRTLVDLGPRQRGSN